MAYVDVNWLGLSVAQGKIRNLSLEFRIFCTVKFWTKVNYLLDGGYKKKQKQPPLSKITPHFL